VARTGKPRALAGAAGPVACVSVATETAPDNTHAEFAQGPLEAHPLADIFPLLDGPELAELAADIGTHGQREPIVTYESRVLDGRNRYRACLLAGVRPWFKPFDGVDPLAFVVSANLKRRHLTESQRAMVAARLATLRDGQRADLVEGLPIGRAATLLNVGDRSVARAREVLEHGAPELQRAVDQGAIAVSTASDIAARPIDEQSEIVARGVPEILRISKLIRAERTEMRRAEQLERIAAQCDPGPLPQGPWPVIFADPPWRYEFSTTSSRAIEHHYETMSLEDICALGVGEIAAPNAVLFFCCPQAILKQAFEVFRAWDFRYRSGAVWEKTCVADPDELRIGEGFYFRFEHELFLLATRGDFPPPPPALRPPSVIRAPRTKVHSEKPDALYAVVEHMYPGLPRLELFCRGKPRPGWAAWGNEALLPADTVVSAPPAAAAPPPPDEAHADPEPEAEAEPEPPAEPPDEAEPTEPPDEPPSPKRRRNPPGLAILHRRAKLGDKLIEKIKGTSLDSVSEMNGLVMLNRGAPAGEHTEIVRLLVADAVAGKTVSATAFVVQRRARRAPRGTAP
jgi:N6-adenosine-specific RNA methylase IME4/ParB-like chromosome segregation protein Spo0J